MALSKERLCEIYVKLSEEVDELHNQFEALKVEPDTDHWERRQLLEFAGAAGPRDNRISQCYTVPYLLYEIRRKLVERSKWKSKLAELAELGDEKELRNFMQHLENEFGQV